MVAGVGPHRCDVFLTFLHLLAIKSKKFQILGQLFQYDQVFLFLKSQNSHLASVHSEEEDIFLQDLAG